MFLLKSWTAGFWESVLNQTWGGTIVQPVVFISKCVVSLAASNNSAWHATRIDCNVSSIYTWFCPFHCTNFCFFFTELLQTKLKWQMILFHSCRTTSYSLLSAYCNLIKDSPTISVVVFFLGWFASHFRQLFDFSVYRFTNGRHQKTTYNLGF